MNIAVTGATGRMGKSVIEEILQRSDSTTVSFATSQKTQKELPNHLSSVEFPICNPLDFSSQLQESNPDVIIDLTVPEASLFFAENAAKFSIPLVTGTTGFTDEQLNVLHDLSNEIPILFEANFSRGIASLHLAIDAISDVLFNYDVELTETHHNKKIDAPSGTLLSILDTIKKFRPNLEAIYGRSGIHERQPNEVGVHSVRAGNIRGSHEVLFSGNDEMITLTHQAESRGVYSSGAIDSAIWLSNQPPGWYDFKDVLGVST
ncbi:MAG TPA: 4-hydroxy-tetrahydrodipicolinate reductase [Halobacteriales archaeon]|uniref:4-hydroxy-tetrahydrodipicolinate reductase n=1 Tax=Candidatus Hikarchaeum yamanae TaxID=2675326 RepID=UPI0017F90040|nr:4-hydroxy-tetrahydrodipicolinate reductase [Halobacteriales archaeon]|tara:strand:+ start:86892 stop:87677 length:786 start_codon:yes stop_codon:yes gene_type:complete